MPWDGTFRVRNVAQTQYRRWARRSSRSQVGTGSEGFKGPATRAGCPTVATRTAATVVPRVVATAGGGGGGAGAATAGSGGATGGAGGGVTTNGAGGAATGPIAACGGILGAFAWPWRIWWAKSGGGAFCGTHGDA